MSQAYFPKNELKTSQSVQNDSGHSFVEACPWTIMHLNLSQPLPDLAPIPGTEGVCAFLWWQQMPLGNLELTTSQLPLFSQQLRQLALTAIAPTVGSYLLKNGLKAPLPGAFNNYLKQQAFPALAELMALKHPLDQLQQRWENGSVAMAHETVSVIICTRDRPEQLARCLRSLRSLVTPPHEILVIDNAPSSEATKTLVVQFPEARYFRELRPGLSIARNTGIRNATGTLVAFTDDDVEVYPYWIEQLRTAFQAPQVMAMTGLILPARLETEAEQVFQRGATGFGWGYRPLTFDANFFAEMKPFGVPVWRIGAGANMAFRRKIFDELGGFDERLGAGASGCSEDSEFWYRILAAGWRCQYQPTAVVSHHHRADLTSLNQQMEAYMRGHVTALMVQAERHHHWGNLRRLFIALPRYYVKQVILGSFYRFQGKYCTVFAEIRGCLTGITYYLTHRKSMQATDDFTQSRHLATRASASNHN